jgi:ribosomal-protein-alanine N-acetyltransferase
LITEIRTHRLLLRGWRAEDREPFAAMNADPAVREYFRSVLSRDESDSQADWIEAELSERRFGLWAVEIPGVTPFAGFTGLSVPAFKADFTPCVELGWRLAREHWGHGYATEAARAAVEFGFTQMGLDEIVAFTVPANTRSIRVMEKLGMKFSGEFDHPAIAEGHPLRRHVLYRLGRRF